MKMLVFVLVFMTVCLLILGIMSMRYSGRSRRSRHGNRSLLAGVSHLETLHKAAGEEARPAGALKRPLVPAVLTFLVHKHNVAFLQLDLGLALRRIRDEHTVPEGKRTDTLLHDG